MQQVVTLIHCDLTEESLSASGLTSKDVTLLVPHLDPVDAETHLIGLDGETIEIDLCEDHFIPYREMFAFVQGVGRRPSLNGSIRRKPSKPKPPKPPEGRLREYWDPQKNPVTWSDQVDGFVCPICGAVGSSHGEPMQSEQGIAMHMARGHGIVGGGIISASISEADKTKAKKARAKAGRTKVRQAKAKVKAS